MINLIEKKRGTKITVHDYVFDTAENILELLPELTPKFEGNWTVALVEPSIKFAGTLFETGEIPDYMDVDMYLSTAKLEQLLLKYPKLQPKKMTQYETFMEFISLIRNHINHDAAKYLFKACDRNAEEAEEVLSKLDVECSNGVIDLALVKKHCVLLRKPVYASEVYTAFMLKDKWRWKKLDALEKDLGTRYAYYAMRKQSVQWLSDKASYLHNEDTKNRHISEVDASFISYAYICFANSKNYNELTAVMYDIDNRSTAALERRLEC